jgi:roadblock/LC7 domain-containing protein
MRTIVVTANIYTADGKLHSSLIHEYKTIEDATANLAAIISAANRNRDENNKLIIGNIRIVQIKKEEI